MMLESVAEAQVVGWARVFPTIKREFAKGLRQGVWYAVLRDERADRVTLMVASRGVDVPRRILELRPTRPAHFGVVFRLEDARVPDEGFGDTRHYVACPACAHRQTVFARPSRQCCRGCGFEGPVGWWEA